MWAKTTLCCSRWGTVQAFQGKPLVHLKMQVHFLVFSGNTDSKKIK